MTIFPKRVWTKKGMVFHDKKPVWKLGDKLWVYDPNFTEVDSWKVYPEKAWENVPATDELLIYDWEQPTDIGTFEDWLESTYQFVDWDGTVLKSWKVKDGETPVAPADPTRPETAAATYTFSGWNPTVWPINKNTEYVAQYEETPKNYTVTILVNPEWAGTVDIQQVTVPYASPIGYNGNELTVGDYTITATAGSGYAFFSWGTIPYEITEDTNVTATFEEVLPQIEFACRDADTKELGWGVVTMNGEDTTTNLTFTAKVWDTMSYNSENKTFTIVGDFTNVIWTNPDQYRFVYSVEVDWKPIDFTSITITGNMTINFLFAQY